MPEPILFFLILILFIFIIDAFILIVLLLKQCLKNFNITVFIQYHISKISNINLWNLFMTAPKTKAFPYDMKKYFAKNGSIKVQIKLSQCSKQFHQIIQRHRGKQCGKLFIHEPFFPNSFHLEDTNLTIVTPINNPYLCANSPLTVKKLFFYYESYTLTEEDLNIVYPKLDLRNLQQFDMNYIILNSTTFKKYLVPSLVELNVRGVALQDAEISLIILQQCPSVTNLCVSWQPNMTSLSKLAAIKRKTKLKEFQLLEISEPIHIQDIIDFFKNQMYSECFISLQKNFDEEFFEEPLYANFSFISNEEMMKRLQKNVQNFDESETNISCKILK